MNQIGARGTAPQSPQRGVARLLRGLVRKARRVFALAASGRWSEVRRSARPYLARLSVRPSTRARLREQRSAPSARAKAALARSVEQRLANLEDYQAQVDSYREAREARRETGKHARYVLYTAIVGGYDTLKLPTEFHADIDYVLFTDQPIVDVGVFEIRPITFVHEDPTRTARYVKTHPHELLPEYDVAIWLDSNIAVMGDVMEFIEEFEASGKAAAGIQHPQRDTLDEEFAACMELGKDDHSSIQAHQQHYQDLGFTDDGLIESNFMVFAMTQPAVREFFTRWWEQIDRFSRRDQLSVAFALRSAGIELHPLMLRPMSVRTHPSFNFTKHDRGQGPSKRLLEALRGQLVDPYGAPSYAEVRAERIAAQRGKAIDVIVCVHNALDDVRACLESVAKVRGDGTGVVIVDDCSEPPTAEFLVAFTKANPWAAVHRNEVRQGYTKSANRGLSASQAEFCILLNSDTIVTDGFAEKMLDALESTPGAGIVGPLSNAASHQSIPDHRGSASQTAVNVLPDGVTPHDMNAHCERVSPVGILPRVSLVHGFCLGLSRQAIDVVGTFDAESFPDGYGEENDYCLRAVNAGVGLVIATHTYVFHSKSKSYGGETRLGLAKAGSETFHRLHGTPRIKRAIASVNSNPLLEHHREQARQFLAQVGESAPSQD